MSQNVETVMAMFEAYNRGDIDALLGTAHAEIQIRPAVTGRLEGTVYFGHDGVRQLVSDIARAWGEFRPEIEEIRDLGDAVLMLGRIVARGKGSGVPLETPAGWVLKLREGRVSSWESFTSTQAALEAAGLPEQSQPGPPKPA